MKAPTASHPRQIVMVALRLVVVGCVAASQGASPGYELLAKWLILSLSPDSSACPPPRPDRSSSTARAALVEGSGTFIRVCHYPSVQTETPMRWCPECHEARRTTITYEDERSADRIDVPLLVVHGELDTNVPLGEATQVVAALRALGRPVEYLELAGEGHEYRRADSRRELDERLLEFLTRVLAAG